jgi:hypothetical protein
LQEALELWNNRPLDSSETKKKRKEEEDALLDKIDGMNADSVITASNLVKQDVFVPSQKDVESFLLTQRKSDLLKQYVSEDLSKSEQITKELRGMM